MFLSCLFSARYGQLMYRSPSLNGLIAMQKTKTVMGFNRYKTGNKRGKHGSKTPVVKMKRIRLQNNTPFGGNLIVVLLYQN